MKIGASVQELCVNKIKRYIYTGLNNKLLKKIYIARLMKEKDYSKWKEYDLEKLRYSHLIKNICDGK